MNQRQRLILETVNQDGSASIKSLSQQFGVSEATARRDLDDLAASGYVERFHGGAVRVNSTTFERVHSEKMKTMLEEKQRIAAYAASLISDGESVFLDSGSTAFFIAQQLRDLRDLTVVTNNLDIAYSAEFHQTSSLVVTGGVRRDDYSLLIGSLAERTIDELYVDTVFLGCDAVDAESGVFNTNYLELGVKQKIVKCGKRTILVTDHTKFHRKALAKVCELNELDLIITDAGIDEQTVDTALKHVAGFIYV